MQGGRLLEGLPANTCGSRGQREIWWRGITNPTSGLALTQERETTKLSSDSQMTNRGLPRLTKLSRGCQLCRQT